MPSPRRIEDLVFRPAYAPVMVGPCNCCSCRFGHPHVCVSDLGRYPVTYWQAMQRDR